MAEVGDLLGRVAAARDVPDVLSVAVEAFEVMLTVIREHDQPGGEVFVPMVRAAASAANGRDHLLFAPSLPSRPPPGIGQPWTVRMGGREAADWLDAVCRALAARLVAIDTSAVLRRDREAYLSAAACAREIAAVMAGGKL